MDTNHVTALASQKPSIVAKLKSLPPNTHLRACTITLGEIEAGHEMVPTTNPKRRDEFRTFINAAFVPHTLPISLSTGSYYAQIMGRIWRRNPPAKARISTDAHLLSLDVNVNDIWIVASAWEHGLIFLTNDKMSHIRPEVTEIKWENWF